MQIARLILFHYTKQRKFCTWMVDSASEMHDLCKQKQKPGWQAEVNWVCNVNRTCFLKQVTLLRLLWLMENPQLGAIPS